MIASALHVLKADMLVDEALAATPQRIMAHHPLAKRAVSHLNRALQLWPTNATAAMALAAIAREGGDVERALALNASVAEQPLALFLPAPGGVAPRASDVDDSGDEDEGDDGGWQWEWVGQPHQHARGLATYMTCLLLEMLGRHPESMPWMRALGVTAVRLRPRMHGLSAFIDCVCALATCSGSLQTYGMLSVGVRRCANARNRRSPSRR